MHGSGRKRPPQRNRREAFSLYFLCLPAQADLMEHQHIPHTYTQVLTGAEGSASTSLCHARAGRGWYKIKLWLHRTYQALARTQVAQRLHAPELAAEIEMLDARMAARRGGCCVVQ